jgi:DNA-binding CsgD family transcriptional regulator
MSRNALPEFSRLLLTLYRTAQETPVHEFQEAALHALKSPLHFDASLWGTATVTEAGLDIHTRHRGNFPDEMYEAFRRVGRDPLVERAARVPRITFGGSTEEATSGPDYTEARQFTLDWSIPHYLATSDLNTHTRFAQWISLFRFARERHCTPAEIEFLDALAPHLMQALTINRLVHMDRLLGDVAREAWSVAIADARGVVYHMDPRFQELIDADWPMTDDHLPAPLFERLRSGDTRVLGSRALVQGSREGDLFFLKARQRLPMDDLSTREAVIADMLSKGLTQKQIAVRLNRSPETVRTQVKTIFAKLGINKATLLPPLLLLNVPPPPPGLSGAMGVTGPRR